jgi:hypothetical protein
LSRIKAIDVHAHFLPAPYIAALQSAGVTTVDNGLPIPHWDADRAIEAMNEADIGCAMLSVSSPFVHFVNQAQAPELCRAINNAAAEIVAKRQYSCTQQRLGMTREATADFDHPHVPVESPVRRCVLYACSVRSNAQAPNEG